MTRALELKQKIHDKKEIVVGMWCFLNSPIMVELVGKAKLVDFIIVDLEHTPYYADRVSEFVLAAEYAGVVPLVRVPDPNPTFIQKVLDAGAKGIFVPQIRNREETAAAIAATRYRPVGTRGAMPGCRGADYTPLRPPEKWAEKVKELNAQMIVVGMPLENIEGINNLESIVSTPGLDVVSLSSVDISHALNHIEDREHPEVKQVQSRCIELAHKYGVAVYALPSRPGEVERWYEKGVRIFTLMDRELVLHGFEEFGKVWPRFGRMPK